MKLFLNYNHNVPTIYSVDKIKSANVYFVNAFLLLQHICQKTVQEMSWAEHMQIVHE